MIATQQIKSTTSKIKNYEDYEKINVLKWNNSKYKYFSPYYLKTDGKEQVKNDGEIIFENFYQGCKVYDIVYNNKVYASKYHVGKPEYLWWDFKSEDEKGDIVYDKENKILNKKLYLRWRNSLWNCSNPIRYPNKIHRRKNTQFSLIINKNNKETKLNYVQARKSIYVKEYIRLVKKLHQYDTLLQKLKDGKKLLICEVNVSTLFINKKTQLKIEASNAC